MATRDGIASRLGETAIGMLPDGPRISVRRVLRKYKERARLRNADITVIAHPKSGSTWLRFQLARVYQRKFDLPEAVIPRIESYHRLNPAIPRLHMAGYEYIKHVIARPAPDSELAGKRVVFVVRHPIDVVVSLYFHILKHATRERKLFNTWPLSLDGTSLYDFALNSEWGLREAIAFYNGCVRHAATMPDAMIISYEEMRTETADVLRRLVRFAGTDISESEVQDVVEFTSFERLREAERTNSFSSYRLRPGNPDDPESFKVRRAKIFGYRDYFDTDELNMLENIITSGLDSSLGYSNMHPDNTHSQ
jgi:hypothetical protein